MPFNAAPGDTVLLPKPNQPIPHLWVILTKPDKITTEIVTVNLTTKRDYSDTTVVLNKYDHPFINHPTVINFADARLVKIDNLTRAVESGYFRTGKPFTPSVLKIIQEGLMESFHTPKKIKDYYRSYQESNN